MTYTPHSASRSNPREIKLVYTDIAIKVPLGHYGRIAPKSGITLKHHVTVLAGVIDPDYTGNVGVVLHNLSSDTKFTRQVGPTHWATHPRGSIHIPHPGGSRPTHYRAGTLWFWQSGLVQESSRRRSIDCTNPKSKCYVLLT